MPRPDPLLPSARRVVMASRVLDPRSKLVWLEMAFLDRGPEGCYARPGVLADRLGISRKTLDRIRPELVDCGLLAHEHRRGYCDSWYVTLPAGCVPSRRPTEAEVLDLSARLDAHLRNGHQAQPTPTNGAKSEANQPPPQGAGWANPTPIRESTDSQPTPIRGGGLPSPVGVVQPSPMESVLSEYGSTSVLSDGEHGGATALEARTDNSNCVSRGVTKTPSDDPTWRATKERLKRGGVVA